MADRDTFCRPVEECGPSRTGSYGAERDVIWSRAAFLLLLAGTYAGYGTYYGGTFPLWQAPAVILLAAGNARPARERRGWRQ